MTQPEFTPPPVHTPTPPPAADNGMLSAILVLAALCAGGLGVLLASQATLGAVFVAGGVLLAVLARMAQASAHHRQVRAWMLACAPAVSPYTTKPLPAAAATLTTEP